MLKTNKSGLSITNNKQLFNIRTHLMRQRHAGAAERYVCPVCKSGFKEKILLAIHIGTRH
jgi:competence CoiA-like predicted nuclease